VASGVASVDAGHGEEGYGKRGGPAKEGGGLPLEGVPRGKRLGF